MCNSEKALAVMEYYLQKYPEMIIEDSNPLDKANVTYPPDCIATAVGIAVLGLNDQVRIFQKYHFERSSLWGRKVIFLYNNKTTFLKVRVISKIGDF